MADTDGQKRDLEIEVGHGVSVDLKSLTKVSEKFSGLIDEVSKEYTGVAHGVRWVVEVERGCVRLPLRAEATVEEVRPAAAHELGTIIAAGLSKLEDCPERPDYFNDKALELAKGLANFTKRLPIAVRNGHAGVEVTQQLSINAEKVLGTPRTTFGTVEGELEALNLHGSSKEFSIYPLGSKGIKCTFGSRLDLERDILPAVSKRVAARGRIKTRPNGERLSVEVHELRIVGDPPASADDVRGILRGYEVAGW
jgi:hypothetical protein